MKLFGNSKGAKWSKMEETAELPQMATEDQITEFDLTGENFDKKLELLLDGKKLESTSQLVAEPPKEMGKPVNTDYHLVKDPIRGTKVRYDDEEEEEDSAGMAGWLKGVLLLLASLIILVLVIFAVYMNLR